MNNVVNRIELREVEWHWIATHKLLGRAASRVSAPRESTGTEREVRDFTHFFWSTNGAHIACMEE